MNLSIHFLEAEGSLAPWRDALCAQAEDIGKRISARVPAEFCAHPVDILIQNLPEGTVPGMGMGGSCFRRGLVTVSLAPEMPGFEAGLGRGDFQQLLAHELHHAMRWNAGGYGETLGEAIVSEGLADAFAENLTGLTAPPWTAAPESDQLSAIVARAEEELANPYYDHAEWFFGSGELPMWTAYTLGYQLARRFYEQNPREAAQGFVDTQASAVLSGWPHLTASAT